MKDWIKEVEQQNQLAESYLDKLSNIFSPKSNNPSSSQIIKNYEKDIESGNECKKEKVGKIPNNLFWSETGSVFAIIGKNKNKIHDISDLKVTKRQLRCYDLSRDVFQIAWLFNGKFEAKKIWDGPLGDNIRFDGIWKSGDFYGIWESTADNWKAPASDFKGTGAHPSTIASALGGPQPREYYTWIMGVKDGPFNIGQIKHMFNTGGINRDTEIWRDGIGKYYVPLAEIPEFSTLF